MEISLQLSKLASSCCKHLVVLSLLLPRNINIRLLAFRYKWFEPILMENNIHGTKACNQAMEHGLFQATHHNTAHVLASLENQWQLILIENHLYFIYNWKCFAKHQYHLQCSQSDHHMASAVLATAEDLPRSCFKKFKKEIPKIHILSVKQNGGEAQAVLNTPLGKRQYLWDRQNDS